MPTLFFLVAESLVRALACFVKKLSHRRLIEPLSNSSLIIDI